MSLYSYDELSRRIIGNIIYQILSKDSLSVTIVHGGCGRYNSLRGLVKHYINPPPSFTPLNSIKLCIGSLYNDIIMIPHIPTLKELVIYGPNEPFSEEDIVDVHINENTLKSLFILQVYGNICIVPHNYIEYLPSAMICLKPVQNIANLTSPEYKSVEIFIFMRGLKCSKWQVYTLIIDTEMPSNDDEVPITTKILGISDNYQKHICIGDNKGHNFKQMGTLYKSHIKCVYCAQWKALISRLPLLEKADDICIKNE